MHQNPSKRWRLPFVGWILVAMALGALVGAWSRTEWPYRPQVASFGQVGTVIIGAIKALAGPLLFLAIVDAFLRTRVDARRGAIMLGITLTNAALALGIGMTIANVLQPGTHLRLEESRGAPHEVIDSARKLDFLKELVALIPTSVVRPFLENSVIAIVVLAVLLGAALRRVKNEQEARGENGYRGLEEAVATAFRAVEVALAWVIKTVPIAVFAVVAQTVGQYGFRPVVGLSAYVGAVVLGLAIQVLIVYQAWVVFGARMALRRFWAGARDALAFAVGASSSLATLPVTLRCLDRMGVSPASARLAACVGTNLNNDGILLYEAMAVLIVAQVHGYTLSLGQQLLAAAACTLAGFGIAAVPDAGLISLAIVLATVGLPLETLPLLLTVDWLLSRCRAVTNVTSDILVAVLLDRFGGPEAGPENEPGQPRVEVVRLAEGK